MSQTMGTMKVNYQTSTKNMNQHASPSVANKLRNMLGNFLNSTHACSKSSPFCFFSAHLVNIQLCCFLFCFVFFVFSGGARATVGKMRRTVCVSPMYWRRLLWTIRACWLPSSIRLIFSRSVVLGGRYPHSYRFGDGLLFVVAPTFDLLCW